jgi:hypothetical protein
VVIGFSRKMEPAVEDGARCTAWNADRDDGRNQLAVASMSAVSAKTARRT